MPGYVQALCKEVRAWGEYLGHASVHTIFFGGGTPSWIPLDAMTSIMGAIREAFSVQATAEISAEANPGDVTQELMAGWRALGFNRVSMGVQSFDDSLLKLLTRRHTAAEAVASYHGLRQAGFDNLNIDLMYGLPHQSMETWRRSLEQALALAPAHLSLYALTVEEGTSLWQDVKVGKLPPPDPDTAADMYEAAETILGAGGYEHYEISSWARSGQECQHNLVYWRNGPFLGMGPGAHSYFPGSALPPGVPSTPSLGKDAGARVSGERFWTINSPAEYIRRMAQSMPLGQQPNVIAERRTLEGPELLTETLILQLRLDEGLEPETLVAQFGHGALFPHLKTLRRFVEIGLLTEERGVFRLTSKGRLLSNELFVRLLPE